MSPEEVTLVGQTLFNIAISRPGGRKTLDDSYWAPHNIAAREAEEKAKSKVFQRVTPVRTVNPRAQVFQPAAKLAPQHIAPVAAQSLTMGTVGKRPVTKSWDDVAGNYTHQPRGSFVNGRYVSGGKDSIFDIDCLAYTDFTFRISTKAISASKVCS